MEALKNTLLDRGLCEKAAEFINNTVHDNFKEILMTRIQRNYFKDDEFFRELERFALELQPTHEIYEGRKTTYLIQLIFFHELLTEVEKIDNDEEYVPFYSPVLVSKVGGAVVFD